MTKKHNDFIFQTEGNEVTLIRDFEGMYRDCEDPHGQSNVTENLSYQLVLTTVERAASLLKAESDKDLLIMDMGCGLGYFTAHLKKKFPDAYVCGVDISNAALERASQIASGCVFQQADLKTPDLISLGIRYDIIVALDSLYYFSQDEINQVVSNIRSLLVDGGFLVVGYHLPEQMNFGLYIRSLSDAKSLFNAHGISIVYSFDVENALDMNYVGSAIGRHLYFLAKKMA